MKLTVPVTSFDDITLNFEQIEAQGIHTGTGVPAFQARKGDLYFRRDTPSTANQRVYINTADGANWTGII